MTAELDRAVATSRDDDGVRHLELTSDWNTPNGTANGGYVLAVCLQAVLDETEGAGHPDPLSIAVSYFKPSSPGTAQVHVRTLRTGRRVSVHESRLVQDGRDIAHAIVTLHDWDAAGDVEHTPHTAPDAGTPEDGTPVSALVPPGSFPIVDRYDCRLPVVPGWLRGEPNGVPEALAWLRPADGRPIDALAAAALTDGFPPVTAELGHLASSTVQLTVHLRRRPAASWVLMHVVTRHVIAGYHDEDVELWDEQGRLVAQSRQLAVLS